MERRRRRGDALVLGHTHQPLVVRADAAVLVNPGSVGEGTADDRRPSWAWLAWDGERLAAGLERVERPLASVRERQCPESGLAHQAPAAAIAHPAHRPRAGGGNGQERR